MDFYFNLFHETLTSHLSDRKRDFLLVISGNIVKYTKVKGWLLKVLPINQNFHNFPPDCVDGWNLVLRREAEYHKESLQIRLWMENFRQI